MQRETLCFLGWTLLALTAGEVAAQQRQPPPARPDAATIRGLRSPDLLKEGAAAPDFTLKYKGGDEEVTLSHFKGDKPVALVFGSYT